LELLLLYNTARFEEGAIARLLSHLELLLNAFVEHPQAKLCELPRLTADERASLAVMPPKTPGAKTSSTIHRLIEAQAAKTPQAEAVVFAGTSLTYDALNRQANQLAVVLREHNVTPGSRVAMCLNRSLEMIVCILAVLKAGAVYVPLDPDYPQHRLAYCLEDTDPIVICTERAVELPAVDVPLLYVDDASLYESSAAENLSDLAEPEDLAYIIYTSGSTGQPKGVMVSHRNLVHSTQARFSVYDESVGRFLLLSSIAFDSSVAGLFWTLCQGGTLVISPPRIEQDLQQLAELIAKERITYTLCVPTLYALLIATVNPAWLATLRTVIVAGEACAKSLVKQHYKRLPQAQLYNEYGPTEATVWCTAYQVPSVLPLGPIAIGMAIPGTQIVLVDEHLQPVPTGAVGEIAVGGAGVSQGYWHQEQKTAAAFFDSGVWQGESTTLGREAQTRQRFYRTGDLGRWRADGTLEWLGRRDRQVKIRGYRIELGEIEEVLRSHSSVQEAVVIPRSLTSSTAVVPENSEIDSIAQALAALPVEDAAALISIAEKMPATGGT
ncbi:MAG: amino acid adenylation domain-containing protein, partial [Cyanobacteria bacterium J06606_4]